MKPAPARRTAVASSYTLAVRPEQHTMHGYYDAAGNDVARAFFHDKVSLLEIDVALTADLAPVNPFDFLVDPGAERFPIALAEKPEGSDMIDLVARINERVKRDIGYVARIEHVGSGSCRDSSWLLTETLRHLGIAARFVSGYLIQLSGALPIRRRPIARTFTRGRRRTCPGPGGSDSIRPPACSPQKGTSRSLGAQHPRWPPR